MQSGIDSNLNNDSAGDRTIINPAGSANAGSGVTPYNSAGQAVAMGDPSTVAYVANNPNARYVVAGLGALANGGRNSFPLRPTDNIDLSLLKRFNITERIRFEIAGQFFNVLNHAQYTGGFLSDVAGSSQINSRNDLIPSKSLSTSSTVVIPGLANWLPESSSRPAATQNQQRRTRPLSAVTLGSVRQSMRHQTRN